MAPGIAPDLLHGNAPDLPNTPAYVNPPQGYLVLLSAADSKGIQPTTTFDWVVSNSSGVSIPLSGETPSLNLPLGPYTVMLKATGLLGAKGPEVTKTPISVKDVLIASIGDSVASGEGNPVVADPFNPEWAYSPNPAMNLENANAHRSTLSGPAQFALQLQQANPHEAVTFVSVANSGATIPQGLLGPMQSIGDSSYTLPAEIGELKSIIGSRRINVLTLTVGADDILFRQTAESLVENTYFGYPSRSSILATFRTNLANLPNRFADLSSALKSLNPSQVLVTGYPDITRNQFGNVAEFLGPGDLPLISKRNALLASQKIIPELNATIATAVKAHGWTLVSGINADFRTHGYPSTDSWVRTFGESLFMQGNEDGTFHPNAAGQLAFATRFLDAALPRLRRLDLAAPSRPH